MDKLGVEVTKAQLEHAAQIADVITGDKVQKKIVAGTGATLTTNQDGTETLNVTGGGGGTVDTAMSDSSTNAVQNKVIKAYVDKFHKIFKNITVLASDWSEEQTPTYADYPYRANITCQGVLSTDLANVYFAPPYDDDYTIKAITSANTVSLFIAEIPDESLVIDCIIVEATV